MLTTPPTMVSGNSVVMTGVVRPGATHATFWFEYGPGTAYTMRTSSLAVPPARRPVPVKMTVSGLAPLSPYHYRLVATNCGGCASRTVRGAAAPFTTGGYHNAVYGAAEAADPSILDLDGAHRDYWAYTTGDLFPILHSGDLVNWSRVGTAFNTRPSWAVPSGEYHPWAPSVVKVGHPCPGGPGQSCYVMYYVSVAAQWHANCVAVATAASPQGPFTDRGPLTNGTLDAVGRPIGCGDANGYGMIDPYLFTDPASGRSFLYSSEDFTCYLVGVPCTAADSQLRPTISVIPMADDLLHAAGERRALLTGDPGSWESADLAVPTVEGPAVTLHGGTYYLFYSGGNWRADYGMGYATSASPTGPFVKAGANPILAQRNGVLSTGGGEVPQIGPHGGLWLVYHGREGSLGVPRTMRIDPFSWRSLPVGPDAPVIGGPTSGARPDQP